MSQSEAHRRLVASAAQAIQTVHPTMRVTADLLDAPGEPVPPLIGGYRPDIVASGNATRVSLIIAEAKTDGDIDNRHTHNQIRAFIDHLETMNSGTFVLAVNGNVADTARTVLRFACRERVSDRLHIKLFDGLDFWSLGPLGETLWRLC